MIKAEAQRTHLQFKENLPALCPPPLAASEAYEGVWRFVNSNPVTDQDFASYHALGKPCPPSVPPCKWASSSLFLNKDAAFGCLPKPRKRFKYIARVNISKRCGVSILTRSHIDFWRFAVFVPSVIAIEDL
jgi:hypothetical protein